MPKGWSHQEMARRVVQEIKDGDYVNVGIGLPTLILDEIPPDKQVFFHTENGLLGMGPPAVKGHEDPDLVDAGKRPITAIKGAAYFSQNESFVMMRGGHIDVCVIGAFQVSKDGDLANCMLPNSPPSIGGAMDVAVGAKKVVVITDHVTKDGAAKIVNQCTYPLTARRVVDLIVTNLGVMKIAKDGIALIERHPEVTVEEIQAVTEPKLINESGL